MEIVDDVSTQTRQALANIDAALAEAGSSVADVVRVHYYLPDATEFEECWPILREYFGEVRPAATMLAATWGVVTLIPDETALSPQPLHSHPWHGSQ